MEHSDDLFQLIRSLSKNEKGYFKKSSSFHTIGKKNKYLLLFDVIERQKVYDEQAIKKKFASENFVKQLSVVKNYLHKLILQSTEQYRNTVSSQLRSYLNQIDFLNEKHLFGQSFKLLAKAKQLALKHEKYHELSMLLEVELKLLSTQAFTGKTEIEIGALFNAKEAVIKKMETEHQFHYAFERFNLLARNTGFSRTPGDLEKYKAQVSSKIFQSVKYKTSFRASCFYYSSLCIYFLLVNDSKIHSKYAREFVEFIENNPHQIAENPIWYINALSAQCFSYDPNEISEAIKKLRSISTSNKSLQKMIFYVSMGHELNLSIKTGNYKGGVKAADYNLNREIGSGWNKFDDFVLMHTSAQIYFGLKKYGLALKCIKKIIDDEEVGNINFQARIFFLIICFEMGKFELLEHTVVSVYRYLYKRSRLFKFENLVLTFIRKKIPKTDSDQDRLKAFMFLKKELEVILKDPNEKTVLDYFDFISWLESKIQNKSFEEIAISKSKTRKA